ncbi:glycosyltransferase family 2 protein [Paraburkholderia hospita]|uniref:glycosyltransferase family 2 protein n=1 Tax=Paraburkholderia hospita TaxID=169430 RepID=UPI0002718B09|nr:glycosyl transferase family 2 [Burkholderia sp. BT03]SKC94024.1 hypothetical protein SAMN06266956_5886 [Paraburkholderia hospita]
MPVYNGGSYFKQALRSALDQDYANIEIIVVNDGSTDGGETELIALEHGSRVRYFWQKNTGVAGALNTAIKHATGDYFAWLSHDDIHLPNKTTSQIQYLKILKRPDACLFSDYDHIDLDGNLISNVALPAERIRATPRLPLLNGFINGCTLLIPMWIMREYGPFDETLRYTQDYDLWNRILRDRDFYHQRETLVQYRIHPGQDSHKPLAVTEGDALWKRMVSDLTETERANFWGSSKRYFKKLGEFLDTTPYKIAAEYSRSRITSDLYVGLTSVIIPFWNDVDRTVRAARSALSQVDANVQVVMVNDGSTEDLTPLIELCKQDSRIRLLHQPNSGAAAARNRGMLAADGEYIAFLDGGDVFLPAKVTRQRQLMQDSGALISHTSYYVTSPEISGGLGLVRSGRFGGNVYPDIIGSCPIVAPTVMVHRSIVDGGFIFPIGSRIGEDILAWIDLATKYLVLGIDEPLSVIEVSATSAALSSEKQALGFTNMISALATHPFHSKHVHQIDVLRHALHSIAKEWIADGHQFNRADALAVEHLVSSRATFDEFPDHDGGRIDYHKRVN